VGEDVRGPEGCEDRLEDILRTGVGDVVEELLEFLFRHGLIF
jgi:hypothetical protein